jgi:nitrate reductase NapD
MTVNGAQELHIAGLVVHAMPLRLAAVRDAVSALPGACVHGDSPLGKLVVTLEAHGADPLLATLRDIQAMQGVVSASLVYQCADSLDAMNEVLPDGDRTT